MLKNSHFQLVNTPFFGISRSISGGPPWAPGVPGGTRAQRDVLRRGIALRRGQLGEAAADHVHQGVAQDVEAHHGEMLMHIVEIYYSILCILCVYIYI